MIDRRCGNCKYIGAKTGEDFDIHGEMQSLHFCENSKSIFKVCIKTATGCNEFNSQAEIRAESEESDDIEALLEHLWNATEEDHRKYSEVEE